MSEFILIFSLIRTVFLIFQYHELIGRTKKHQGKNV